MKSFIAETIHSLPQFEATIRGMQDQIITNSILIGQTPAIEVPVKEDTPGVTQANLRVQNFIERLAELGLQEATSDASGNAVGIIKGAREDLPSIIVAAHMDTVYYFDQECNISVDEKYIRGPGLVDNSISLGVMLSLPDIIETLKLKFNSDIIILGLAHSLNKHNLSGIRNFLSAWKSPVKCGIVLEGAELGRLNYFSRAMTRMDIRCDIPIISGWENKYGSNAIIIMNEIINRIMEIHLPQRPHSQIVIGRIRGGIKHDNLALSAKIGLQIESQSDIMVQDVYTQIEDIVDNVQHENRVNISIQPLSNVNAARIEYNHPLVRTGVACMKALNISPSIESSESELSIFLDRKIPAIAIGLSRAQHTHSEHAQIEIDPLFTGITQLLGILKAVDGLEF